MGAVAVGFIKINFSHHHFLLVMGTFCQQGAEGIGNKGSAPEFHGAILFKSYPVDAYHMHTIGNSMAALDGLPGIVLFCIGCFILRRCPADGCWIKEDFCTHQTGEPGCFGIPLIPTNQHADLCKLRFKNLVS